MAKPVTIGDYEFPTKKAAKQYVRDIIESVNEFEPISEPDHSFLVDLLSKHPESESKIGAGIDFFTVELDSEWKRTRHFVVHRVDNSSTDFSWHTCIDGSSHRSDVLAAMRSIVKWQIIEFKRMVLSGDPICPYTKAKLDEKNSHVDHVPPDTFHMLVSRWMDSKEIGFSDIGIKGTEDNSYGREFSDKLLADEWSRYHKKNANLRLISVEANLSHVKYE